MDLLTEINEFLKEINQLSSLVFTFLDDGDLQIEQKLRAADLLNILSEKVGYLGKEIVSLSGLSSTMPIKGKDFDIWSVALATPITEMNENGLGLAEHITKRALGHMKDDIKNGLRDEKGNLIKNFGDIGSKDGEFLSPSDISVLDDKIYISDTGNSRVQIFDLEGKCRYKE